MTRFLYGLIKDLQNKIHNLIELIERTNIHPDLASDYALQVRGKLEQAQKKLSAMAADKSLLNPKWLYNNLKKYRGLAREVQLIESFPMQVIVHYGEADHYLSNLGKWICKQIGYPLSPPIISTISNEYYWAYPGFRIIALPLGEEFLLLGLPDLYHELAHFLFAEYRGFLVGEFFTDLNKYIDSEQQRARYEAREEPYLTLFDKIKSEWKEKWIIEFSCDMIATYLVGPAYGWGNLKLSANSLSRFDVFGPSMEDFPGVEHPSDEARMRGIFAMLRQLKLENEVKIIDEKWQKYLAFPDSIRPKDYVYFYPDELLTTLSRYIFEGSKNIGLIPLAKQAASVDTHFAAVLNEAWKMFLNKPDEYPEWEKARLREIRKMLKAI